jgi:predicted permease
VTFRLHILLAKLKELFGAREPDCDFDQEMQAHIDLLTERYVGQGMTRQDADWAARRQFGNSALLQQDRREMRTFSWLETLCLDLRHGARQLRLNPMFTAVAMLALAFGIGANTAVFSIVDGVLLRPLSYPDPDRLLKIYETTAEFGQSSVAYPNYLDWRSGSHSFAEMAAMRGDDFNFTGTGEPEQVPGEYVSASLFPVLGVRPLLGRTFLPEEDRQGAACTVILSYQFWQRRFGGDTNILSRALTLNGASCTVVGVLPADFRFRHIAWIFIPIEQWNAVGLRTREEHPGLQVVGRLRPGASMESAQAELTSICNSLAHQYPKTNAGHGAKVAPMKDDMVGYIRPTLLLLEGAVGFVLIIACANVANLLMARSTARRRELAIRIALGAGRKRVVRQLLTESVLLSLGGAAAGLLLAREGIALVLNMMRGTLPRAGEIGIDSSVLWFTLVVSIVSGLVFGVAPAFHGANANLQDFLKEGARGAGGGRHRAEGAFVAVEVGVAVILLTGAGLMMQSLWRLWRVDPGFNTRQLLTAQVALSPGVMASPPAIRLAYDQLLARAKAIPGARSAAMTSLVPLGDSDSEIPFWPGRGPQPRSDRLTAALFFVVTPDYPGAMQIPLRSGRFFTEQDNITSPPVVVVDEVMARHVFPGQDPVGKQLSLMVLGPVQIVGVVGHVKHWGLDSDDAAKLRDQLYFPFQQVPDRFMTEGVAGLTLLLRTAPEPLSLVGAVRAQVAGPTHDQPTYAVRTMEQIISGSLAERRFTMLVLSVFAAAALLLAAIGIYGVMSYSVTRRMHELGIRATLGASRRELLGLVLRQGMRLAAIGMAGGVVATLALTRFLVRQLYGVRPADPVTIAAVALLLGGIALLACYIPARRATTVDPAIALRCE